MSRGSVIRLRPPGADLGWGSWSRGGRRVTSIRRRCPRQPRGSVGRCHRHLGARAFEVVTTYHHLLVTVP